MARTATRHYDGASRRLAAGRNHARIASHALDLFVDGGYASTTIGAVAEVAGVAPQTIYAAFGSKKGLLEHLVTSAVNDPVQVSAQDWMLDARSAPTIEERVRALAEGSTSLLERTATVFTVLHEAKGADPELLAVWEEGSRRRHAVMSGVVQSMVDDGIVDVSDALDQVADALWAMTSPELFRLFVGDRSWTTSRYRGWLESHVMLELRSQR